MANPFGTLVSGLQTDFNTPKFDFLNSYGKNQSTLPGLGSSSSVASTPKTSYTSSLMSVPSNTPPAPVTPKLSGSTGGNASATTPKSSFVDSQVGANANINMPAGANTVGYTYENGRLTSVGGKPVGSSAPSSSTPTSLYNANANYNYGSGSSSTDTSGGATGTSGAPKAPTAQDYYQKAFDAYLASLQPSSEEANLGKDLASLKLQAQKDQDTALERPGQTTAFATGEAARVNRNNAYQIDAESNALDAITRARSGRTDASKAYLDYTKSLLPSNDAFNLSPGQTRYDSSGKPIASLPATPGAPKIIGDSSTGYYTVGDDGKLTKLLGAAPKQLNETQSKQAAYSTINQLLGMADEDGVPYTDQNGYFTAQGFKKLIQNASEDGISRKDFLEQYGDKLYAGNLKQYGLTPKELSDLGLE